MSNGVFNSGSLFKLTNLHNSSFLEATPFQWQWRKEHVQGHPIDCPMSIWIYLYGRIALHGTIEVLRHSLLEGSNGLHFSNICVLPTKGLCTYKCCPIYD